MAKTRTKETKLFSQCEIIVKKIEQKDYKCYYDRYKAHKGYFIAKNDIPFDEGVEVIKDKRVICRVGHHGYETTFKCISPLGFYYYKSHANDKITYNNKGTRRQYTIGFNGGCYSISYLIESNGTRIGYETRPWDLIGNGMSDHFIHDLEKVLNDIIAIMHENGDNYNKKEVDDLKYDLFVDLFGNKDGMKAQTNDLKILSHGFDLKTSFRKRKES